MQKRCNFAIFIENVAVENATPLVFKDPHLIGRRLTVKNCDGVMLGCNHNTYIMAIWGMNIWDVDIPCYVFVEDTEQFMQDNTQGIEILFHLPALPFLATNMDKTASRVWTNLRRHFDGIERLLWKNIKGLQGATQSMKEIQHFINVDGVIEMLQKNRLAKKFLDDRELLPENAVQEFSLLCLSLKERFRLNPLAWDNPNPRVETQPAAPPAQPPLPPLPIAAVAPPEDLDPNDAAFAEANPIALAVVPRAMGRPRYSVAEAKLANEKRNDVTFAKSQIRIATQLLAQHNLVHGGMSLREAFKKVGEKRKPTTVLGNINVTKKQKVVLFTECVETVFPSLWTVLLGIDMAFMSFQAAATLRSFVGSQFMQPPREWVSDYGRILSSECETEFQVVPKGSEQHPTLTERDDGGGRPLTSRHAISTSLERLLRWHIIGAIAEGHDLRPYLIDSAEGKVLQYKITFDTTQTCKQDLFMMGVIPHSFPLSASQRTINGNVQSANNVLILCLAYIGESTHVIQKAVPGLRQDVLRLSTTGTNVVLSGGVELRFRVEFHVAADLKALWLALGLKNFVCPFCVQTSFNENIDSNFETRELVGCLGVPSQRVHLCSLHATLRIVERLIKNAASFVYQHTEKKFRMKKLNELSKLLETRLQRKKFKITVTSKADAASEELPSDEVFIDNDEGLGKNVGDLVKNNVLIKLSALTGSQAVKIIKDASIYEAIITITEQPCSCRILRRNANLAGKLPIQIQQISCRLCIVKKVWSVFATEIFPLVRSIVTPQSLLDALEIGENAVNQEVERIQALALAWLTSYVRVYGKCVTPYVHVIGRHLHHMLSRDSGFTIGTWSQQGFEACHKLVRKILNRKTAHGGGRARLDGESLSPLLQVLQHVYRTKWGMLRHVLSRKPQGFENLNPLFEAVYQDLHLRFEAVDRSYAESHPDRDIKNYIARSCKSALKDAWKREKANLLDDGTDDSETEVEH